MVIYAFESCVEMQISFNTQMSQGAKSWVYQPQKDSIITNWLYLLKFGQLFYFEIQVFDSIQQDIR